MERLSQQRNLIYEIVKASHEHPSAEDIYAEARKSLPTISLGTVYRNLRQLTASGKIRSVHFGAARERFDGILDIHEHFICEVCGKVYDIEPTLGEPALPGKTVTNYRLDYFGTCEACNKRNA